MGDTLERVWGFRGTGAGVCAFEEKFALARISRERCGTLEFRVGFRESAEFEKQIATNTR